MWECACALSSKGLALDSISREFPWMQPYILSQGFVSLSPTLWQLPTEFRVVDSSETYRKYYPNTKSLGAILKGTTKCSPFSFCSQEETARLVLFFFWSKSLCILNKCKVQLEDFFTNAFGLMCFLLFWAQEEKVHLNWPRFLLLFVALSLSFKQRILKIKLDYYSLCTKVPFSNFSPALFFWLFFVFLFCFLYICACFLGW